MRLIQAILIRVFGFQVIIHWEGRKFEHRSITYQDALEWMNQYPKESLVQIIHNGKLVCARY